ncbi:MULTISPECIES: helix-turn-helix transcriptional regulator [unclassified Nocardioides]|uniref:helix-turn-helix transcriptional regulator n=1 Tax=unclassified Nocardioides TaxID=2615069 RepID=UPI0006F49339|nr:MULTISPECIES: WYL domain-containing protein [unclassified Nocardioides]KQY64483.1 transcriptional regulator [Nocardioides sp. Root140]KRF18268.1 transcriptional regulator [Nocardioides sp. Soil796]
MTKSERLLNLLILLLVQRRPLSKQQVRDSMPPYLEAGDEAFDRMFERDKDELRALGVPVEIVTLDNYFDNEIGYRINPDTFALPGITLAADEAAVIGLATRVWQHAGLAAATSDALAKLSAAGVEVDRSRLDIAAPVVAVSDPNFDVLWQASLDRTRVTFDYQRSGTPKPAKRRLEPWGVVSSSGRWYVVGRDVDRGEPRLFRLSRVHGAVKRTGKSDAFVVPPETNLRELTASLSPGPATEVGTALVRQGSGHGLRRTATAVETDVPGPDAVTAWDRVTLTHSSVHGFVDDVLAFGTDAVVESPAEARDLAVRRLTAAAGVSS